MVKLDKLPLEDKHPNKSTIIIRDDKVIVYLFADGFMGLNKQVGYMEIENVFIKDERNKNK